LGIFTPEGTSWTDLIGRAIRSAELHFGEKTLRVLVLKKEGSPDALLEKALSDEFGADQVERFNEESFRPKRIVITTPSLLIPHLRKFGKEKSTLLVLEDAADIYETPIRQLAFHFGLAMQGHSSPIQSKRGNGMVLGFSPPWRDWAVTCSVLPKELPSPPPSSHSGAGSYFHLPAP
jgi:hypothetical protein